VVSASQDKSIRIHQRTDEQLFLEEERENALDAMFEEEEAKKVKDEVKQQVFLLLSIYFLWIYSKRMLNLDQLEDEHWKPLKQERNCLRHWMLL
jgi:hypothetical protein